MIRVPSSGTRNVSKTRFATLVIFYPHPQEKTNKQTNKRKLKALPSVSLRTTVITRTNLGGEGVGGGQTRCIMGKAQVMKSNIYSNVLKA